MAARIAYATPSPGRLSALLAGRWYSIQNQAPDANVHLAAATQLPQPGDAAFVLMPFQTGRIKAAPNQQVYVWTESSAGDSAKLVFDEAD